LCCNLDAAGKTANAVPTGQRRLCEQEARRKGMAFKLAAFQTLGLQVGQLFSVSYIIASLASPCSSLKG
jgi:hypothetical protein